MQHLYFKPRMSGSRHKSSGDVAGITVLFKVLHCKIKKMSSLFLVFFFFMYYLCEKYYKPIATQYYIADWVSWVPRLTLSDLTNKLDFWRCSQNWTHTYVYFPLLFHNVFEMKLLENVSMIVIQCPFMLYKLCYLILVQLFT